MQFRLALLNLIGLSFRHEADQFRCCQINGGKKCTYESSFIGTWKETLHVLSSHVFGAFVTSSSGFGCSISPVSALIWAKACVKAGSVRPQGTCYSFSLVFIDSPLCSVVYTPPTTFFFFLAFSLIFLSPLCLSGPSLHSKIVRVCLNIILFNSRFVSWIRLVLWVSLL